MRTDKKKKPSWIVAVIAALIVHQYNRQWLAGPVSELAGLDKTAQERFSRLNRRLLAPIEDLVDCAVRRGRPPAQATPGNRIELLESLLAVAVSLIAHVPVYKRSIQDRLVQAFERMRGKHGIEARTFCKMLGLKERTFRNWRKRAGSAPPPPREKPPGKQGKRKSAQTGRFELFHLVPDIQAMADTTDMSVLGVPLKCIAVQDPGKRTSRLFEGFGVFTQENADHVIEVVRTSMADRPGMQLLTDQGTPYLAELARRAYDEMDLDHAPQREGSPTEKATLERAFGMVKTSLRPLFDLSNRLAGLLPSLKNPELSRSLGQLLMAVYLRVYINAARTESHPLEGAGAEQIRVVAEQQREAGRKENRSRRLLLEQIHDAYAMEGSRGVFVRAHRHHALEDIQEAERLLRDKACRCQVRTCDRYFAGILRNVSERAKARRNTMRAERQETLQRKSDRQKAIQEKISLEENPERMLYEALQWLADQWIPITKILLAQGRGPGRVLLRKATERLALQNPAACQDRLQALWSAWIDNQHGAEPDAIKSIHQVLSQIFTECGVGDWTPSLEESVHGILTGEIPTNWRSPPQGNLRF
jgi:hypothetical protein